jgi:hypothetical protein
MPLASPAHPAVPADSFPLVGLLLPCRMEGQWPRAAAVPLQVALSPRLSGSGPLPRTALDQAFTLFYATIHRTRC